MFTILSVFIGKFKWQIMLAVLLLATYVGSFYLITNYQQQIAKLRIENEIQVAENAKLRQSAKVEKDRLDKLQTELQIIRSTSDQEQIAQDILRFPPNIGIDDIEKKTNEYWVGLLHDFEVITRGK